MDNRIRRTQAAGRQWKLYGAAAGIGVGACCTVAFVSLVMGRVHEQRNARAPDRREGVSGHSVFHADPGATNGAQQQLAAVLAANTLKPDLDRSYHAFQLSVASGYTPVERLSIRLESIDTVRGRFGLSIRAGEQDLGETSGSLDAPIQVKASWAEQPYLVVFTQLDGSGGAGYVWAPVAGSNR
jgi:hypothetical protein